MLRKKLFVLILAFTFMVSGTAYGSQKTISKNNTIHDTIEALTSNEYMGRLAGTEGNEKAARYIEEKFKKIGLKPYENNSYYQTFSVPLINPDKQEHHVIINFKDGTSRELVYGEEYINRLWVKNFDMTLPVTFNIDDSSANDKIVFLDDLQSVFRKKIPPKCIILKQKYFTGDAGSVSNGFPIIDVKENIYNYLKSKDIKNIKIQLKNVEERAVAKNVIGKISGVSNKNALVISAHFDHVGWQGKTIFKGAVDNASGTAVLLDVAEQLKKCSTEKPFQMDIIICAFNAEEFRILGSEYFVHYIKNKYNDIYNINIDCIGERDGGKFAISGDSKVNKELMEEFGEYLKKDNIEYEKYDEDISSDNVAFTENGIGTISITQSKILEEDEIIHTTNDTSEVLDFDCLEKVGGIVCKFIEENDGKVFKIKSDNQKAPFNYKNIIYKKLSKFQGNEKMEYDEYKIIEVDGYKCKIFGSNKQLEKLEDVKKYYPWMIIPHVNGMAFKEAVVIDYNAQNYVYDKDTTIKEEIEKAYKRDIGKEIDYVYIGYTDGSDMLQVSVASNNDPNYKPNVFNIFDSEEIIVDGETYFILRSKKTSYIAGFYKKIKIHNKTYDVFFNYENIKSRDKITKEAITDFINKISLENIVRCLGF